ncbi:MAG: glycosyl hydrolase family 18 protein [Ignavibacteriaceae bacterium]|jgi:spore germination protein YaaH|nr:glycosyl hydrolase family 18 protein [Ignavibacteriaceae bacterium]
MKKILVILSVFALVSINAQSKKIVFGYLPSWEIIDTANLKIDYETITHISPFSFQANPDGSIKYIDYWTSKWNPIFAKARAKNIKIIFSLTNFNPDELKSILNSSSVTSIMIDNIIKILKDNSLDGINIDFEGLYDEDKGAPMNNFMNQLFTKAKAADSKYEISIALPSINLRNKWNFSYLSAYSDYIIVMAYDYYGSWSDFTAPTSPLEGLNFTVKRSIENDYANVVALNPSKVVLALPYYGNAWRTNSENPFAQVKPYSDTASFNNYIGATYFQDIPFMPPFTQRYFNDQSKSTWYKFVDGDYIIQNWIDDEYSLGLKMDYAISKNLGGIGIWALGYDGIRPELRNLIKSKFNPSDVASEQIIPTEFVLYQNYPNPFNGTTVLKYYMPKENFLKVEVYNSIGELVKILFNGFQNSGVHELVFDAEGFSSGVYFYKITTPTFSETKKLELLK